VNIGLKGLRGLNRKLTVLVIVAVFSGDLKNKKPSMLSKEVAR
jgi:hypothetical protein